MKKGSGQIAFISGGGVKALFKGMKDLQPSRFYFLFGGLLLVALLALLPWVDIIEALKA